jgi:hypothetical protein
MQAVIHLAGKTLPKLDVDEKFWILDHVSRDDASTMLSRKTGFNMLAAQKLTTKHRYSHTTVTIDSSPDFYPSNGQPDLLQYFCRLQNPHQSRHMFICKTFEKDGHLISWYGH